MASAGRSRSCYGQTACLERPARDRQIIVEGEFRILNSRARAMILMSGARLDNPGEVALSGGGLTADGGVFLTGGFAAKGELRLVGAWLAANLTMDSATFDNPGGLAVNLERASIGSCDGIGLTCKGQLSLTGARISGDLDLTGAAFDTGDGRPALLGQRAWIDGKLVLSGIKAQGEVDLRAVKVGASLMLNGAELCNPAGNAWRMSRAQVAADMFCYEMTAVGRVRMPGITVGVSAHVRYRLADVTTAVPEMPILIGLLRRITEREQSVQHHAGLTIAANIRHTRPAP
jgi:hypothetical protein